MIEANAIPKMKKTVLAISLGTFLAGCASQGPTAGSSGVGYGSGAGTTSMSKGATNLTAAQQKMRQAGKAFDTTVVEGALFGAIAGAALGALVGGNGTSAAIGALAGTVAGTAAGTYVANKQSKFASQEQRLNSEIADVVQKNRELDAFIAASQAAVTEQQTRLADLKAKYDAKGVSKSEVESAVALAEESQKDLRAAIEKLNKSRADYEEALASERKAAGGAKVQELDTTISSLKEKIAQLEKQYDGLTQSIQVARVG